MEVVCSKCKKVIGKDKFTVGGKCSSCSHIGLFNVGDKGHPNMSCVKDKFYKIIWADRDEDHSRTTVDGRLKDIVYCLGDLFVLIETTATFGNIGDKFHYKNERAVASELEGEELKKARNKLTLFQI